MHFNRFARHTGSVDGVSRAAIGESPRPTRERNNAEEFRHYKADPTPERRNAIVEANIALVISCAKRFAGRSVQMDDLVADGSVGLIRAVERFDPARGIKFSTFAIKHIEGAMRSSLGRSASAVTMPGRVRTAARRWIREQSGLQTATGCTPSASEVAVSLGLKGEAAQRACDAAKILNATLTDAFDAQLPDRGTTAQASSDARNDDRNETDRLGQAVEGLDPKSARLIRMFFGINGEPALPLAKAARRLGITHEAANRIFARAMTELRFKMNAQARGRTEPPVIAHAA